MNKTQDEIMDYLEYAPIGAFTECRIPNLPSAKMHIYSGYFMWLPDHPNSCGLKNKKGEILFPVSGVYLKTLQDVKDFFKERTIDEAQLI